ncbi:MAG: response regulator [Caldilineaceae bacterium]
MVYKILIIDDEATIRRLLSVLLKRNGHEVLEAADGETGVETANNHQPDIILLDIMMPRVDGFETLRRLRANPNTAEIPVIFVSAKSQVEDRVSGCGLVRMTT